MQFKFKLHQNKYIKKTFLAIQFVSLQFYFIVAYIKSLTIWIIIMEMIIEKFTSLVIFIKSLLRLSM